MTAPYDVAVVGAGPAGTSFAADYLIRKPDARLLLLEGVKRENALNPSQPGAGHSMCSGGLGRYMTEIIGEIPREVIMADVNRAILRSPNEEVEITADKVGASGPIGLVLNRRKWDDWLLGQSIKAGAEYRSDARVVNILQEPHLGFCGDTGPMNENRGRWHLQTKDGQQIHTNFLVGADGPESLVASTCLEAGPIKPKDMFLANEVYVPAPNFPTDAILLEFRPSRLKGYYWAFSGGSIVKVGCGTTVASKTNPANETEWWRDRLAMQYDEPGFTSKPTEWVGGRITAAPPLHTVVDPKRSVAVIGEAARAVWASIGAGDASAVQTGRALANALAHDNPISYQRWWKKQAYSWLFRHYRIKNLLISLSDDQMDRAMRVMKTYQPDSTNTRREVPRLLAHIARHDPLLLGTATAKALLG